jgi:hypothetical protein
MSRHLQNNKVSICHKENCVHAYGKNAEVIAKGTAVLLLFFGAAALIKAASN